MLAAVHSLAKLRIVRYKSFWFNLFLEISLSPGSYGPQKVAKSVYLVFEGVMTSTFECKTFQLREQPRTVSTTNFYGAIRETSQGNDLGESNNVGNKGSIRSEL